MKDLINKIDVSQFRDLFENCDIDRFAETMHYSLEVDEGSLYVDFKVCALEYDYRIKVTDIEILDIKILNIHGIAIHFTDLNILKIEQEILQQLKDL